MVGPCGRSWVIGGIAFNVMGPWVIPSHSPAPGLRCSHVLSLDTHSCYCHQRYEGMQPRGSTWYSLNPQDPVWTLSFQCCKLSQSLFIPQIRHIRYFVIVMQSLLIKGNTFLLLFTRFISKAEKHTHLFYLGFTWHRSIQRWRSQNKKTVCFLTKINEDRAVLQK
jgi:hypothetical protein